MMPAATLPDRLAGRMPPAIAPLLALALLLLAPAANAGALAPGDYQFKIDHGGRHRNYYVHVPPQATGAALPAVVFLHGGGGNARQFRDDADLNASADRHGFIGVYPNGTGGVGEHLLTWNSGRCCGYALDKQVDDVGFIAAVLDDLQARTPVDDRRIYAAGHSNGGMMAHRLGEMLPGRLAAIASVSGAHVIDASAPGPVPVLHIHSVDDPRAPFAGGLGPPFPMTNHRVQHPPVSDALMAWVLRDHCDREPVQRDERRAGSHTARLLVYGHCSAGTEVALWKLAGPGHGWPGAKVPREKLVGPATRVIDANEEIWTFFARFSLAERGSGAGH